MVLAESLFTELMCSCTHGSAYQTPTALPTGEVLLKISASLEMFFKKGNCKLELTKGNKKTLQGILVWGWTGLRRQRAGKEESRPP